MKSEIFRGNYGNYVKMIVVKTVFMIFFDQGKKLRLCRSSCITRATVRRSQKVLEETIFYDIVRIVLMYSLVDSFQNIRFAIKV